MELELKAEKDNAKVRVDHVEDYQQLVDAEWKIIYSKLEACIAAGVKIVLSRLAIGDLATQYFADRGVFCAGRVPRDDLAVSFDHLSSWFFFFSPLPARG